MIDDKLIAELFLAPEEGTLKVNGISGRFITNKLVEFLVNAENDDTDIEKVIDAIMDKFGSTNGMYTVVCAMEYVEEEKQDSNYTLPGYYMIGKIISVKQEV